MKRALAVTFAVFILGLVGIFAWYVAHTRRINAELAQFVADAEARKMVKVTFAVTPPPDTPKDQMLYLSGSVPALGNWDAAGIPLQRRDDGKYVATAEVMSGIGYGYKITRGTWGTVETDAAGKPIDNRPLEATNDTTLDVPVAGWIDGGKTVPGRVTTAGTIVLHRKFPSKTLKSERTLVVYLPPSYEQQSSARFPVLYMQDGQNLFDESTSYQGIEWRMDEAAQQLIAQGALDPVIIVGIYNTEQRDSEYTPPWAAASGKPAAGDDYARFVVDEVKPFIEKTYRVAPGRENTAIGGASMGGLIAMHVAKVHRDAFGKIALVSPWLRAGGKPIAADWVGDGKWLADTKLYVCMGTTGGANYPGDNPIADGKDLAQRIRSAGVNDLQYNEIEGDRHDEASFQRHVEVVLTALFAPAAPTTQPDATAPAAAAR